MKRTLGPLVLALVVLQGATGCSYSNDRYVYKSTYAVPKAPFVQYVMSKETPFSYDMPPQTLMVIDLDTGHGVGDSIRLEEGYANKLTYALYPIDATPYYLRQKHYHGTPIDSGTIELTGEPVIVDYKIGQPIDPASIPTDRPIEEIEQDLPEPDAAPELKDLPEPDAE